MPRARYLPLNVPGDLYDRIERLAEAEERTPIQQSVWLIKRALADQPNRATDRDLAPVGDHRPDPQAA